MVWAELRYHSNDYTFVQIMADVLNVVKYQLRQWREEKLKAQQDSDMEESKSSFSVSTK